jgi:hypothetical protein
VHFQSPPARHRGEGCSGLSVGLLGQHQANLAEKVNARVDTWTGEGAVWPLFRSWGRECAITVPRYRSVTGASKLRKILGLRAMSRAGGQQLTTGGWSTIADHLSVERGGHATIFCGALVGHTRPKLAGNRRSVSFLEG